MSKQVTNNFSESVEGFIAAAASGEKKKKKGQKGSDTV